MNIIFLGNNFNLISIKCLDSLVSLDSHHVIVGVYDPREKSTIQLIQTILKKYGLWYLLRKVFYLFNCRVRISLRKRGLGSRLVGYRSLEELILQKNIPHFNCDQLHSQSTIGYIKKNNPDLITVAAFNKIIKPTIIEIPARGIINVHPSLLPKYRGPNPFYWVLKNQESKTGVTIHYIDEGIDTGNIILQEEMEILLEDNEITLRDRSINVAERLFIKAIRLIEEGIAPNVEQNELESSFFPLPPRGQSQL